MAPRITVTRDSEDGLSREEWVFWFDDQNLVLDIYRDLRRATRRHDLKPSAYYQRRDRRYNTVVVADVEIPPWVAEAALQQFTQSIRVMK